MLIRMPAELPKTAGRDSCGEKERSVWIKAPKLAFKLKSKFWLKRNFFQVCVSFKAHRPILLLFYSL